MSEKFVTFEGGRKGAENGHKNTLGLHSTRHQLSSTSCNIVPFLSYEGESK